MPKYYKPLRKGVQRGQRFGANPGWGPNPAGGHNGDDYLSQVGEEVYAAGDGEVIFAGQFDTTYADNFGWNLNFGGHMVVLNLDGATAPYVEYGHLQDILVEAGQRVRAGQVIATTGATDGGSGVITGPHLHVGVLPHNFNLNTNTYGRVNPDLYLTEYWEGGSLQLQSSTPTQLQGTPSPDKEDDMLIIARDTSSADPDKVWIGNGITRRHVPDPKTLAQLQDMARSGALNVFKNGDVVLFPEMGLGELANAEALAKIAELEALVAQLSVKQGVTIDYAKIAKAVNDDAAARMVK